VKTVPKFSIAKALVRHPDRAKIVLDSPDITEREAKEETKKFKNIQAQYEQYSDQSMHKLTKSIVTRLNAFLKEGSPLDLMLDGVFIHNAADFEYWSKIVNALDKLDGRVMEVFERMNLKKEIYETPGSEAETESAETGDDPDADEEAFQKRLDDMGTAVMSFRKSESDD